MGLIVDHLNWHMCAKVQSFGHILMETNFSVIRPFTVDPDYAKKEINEATFKT